MDNHELWRVMNEAWSALTNRFEPEVERSCKEFNLEPRQWMLLLSVLTFEPEDTTPGHLMVRGPYTSSDAYLGRLREAAKLGYLDVPEESRFRLSDKGRNTALELIRLAREAMVKADPLQSTESREMANLTDKLVQNSLNTKPPPDRWSIRLSYKLMPEMSQPMPYIEQGFSCLAAYRDDSHLAAWLNSGLSATSLEALTLFWRGEISTLKQLCNHLSSRGHAVHVYQDAMAELIHHGYLAGSEDSAWVTGSGRVFRNQVEEVTDRYFYAPWTCLDQLQKQNLYQLLIKLSEGLRVEGN